MIKLTDKTKNGQIEFITFDQNGISADCINKEELMQVQISARMESCT